MEGHSSSAAQVHVFARTQGPQQEPTTEGASPMRQRGGTASQVTRLASQLPIDAERQVPA
jgi:hypothetical protein